MTLEVLQSKSQVIIARKRLKQLGVSFLPSYLERVLNRLRLKSSLRIGDLQKSWDVLRSLEFIGENVSKKASVLDIGCFNSEILPGLHRLGYTHLTGVDLNPKISLMPHPETISYICSDFMLTGLRSGTFYAVTAVSVIEHGFNPLGLLREVSRLLRTGGYFIASFDYWPDKIDTSETKIFDMSWKIFSESEILEFISLARLWGMEPVGEVKVSASERVVSCLGKNYTFGWLVLKKIGE